MNHVPPQGAAGPPVNHVFNLITAFAGILNSIFTTVTAPATLLYAICSSGPSAFINTVIAVFVNGAKACIAAAHFMIHALHRISAFFYYSACSIIHMFFNLPRTVFKVLQASWSFAKNSPDTGIKVLIGSAAAGTYVATCTASALTELPGLITLAALQASIAVHDTITPFAALLPNFKPTFVSLYQRFRQLVDPAATVISSNPVFVYLQNKSWQLLQPHVHHAMPMVVAAANIRQVVYDLAGAAYVVMGGILAGWAVNAVMLFAAFLVMMFPFFLAFALVCLLVAVPIISFIALSGCVCVGGLAAVGIPAWGAVFLARKVIGWVQGWVHPQNLI